jgi:hypothetical protein
MAARLLCLHSVLAPDSNRQQRCATSPTRTNRSRAGYMPARSDRKLKIMPQLDQEYLFLAHRLIADLQANPAAIGVYALIARLFLIYQEPIPLSAADLQRYDPTLSYGAARGALQRLVALRWLNEQSGHKNHYTPTWGPIKGIARPWRMDAPTLGRPAHVVTLRLDRRLLDVGLGKLVPHPTYPAQTGDRYLEQPILSLRDVGAYAQALGGRSIAATPALLRYGLIRNGQAQPLPSTEALIALASQRTLSGDGAPPTEHGLRKLGLEPSSAPTETRVGQPLFFVDHDLIPDPITSSIPDLIPLDAETECPLNTAERAGTEGNTEMPIMAGNPEIQSETRDSPPNPPERQQGGSGGDQHTNKEAAPRAARPETESAKLLRSINAFPSSIEELADMPAELVGGAIAYAQAEPGIESIPGWVVEALRKHRDEGWPIPAPRTKQIGMTGRDRPIDIETYTSGAYGDLFRRGSDTSGLDDAWLVLEEHERVLPEPAASAPAPAETLVQSDQRTGAQGETDEAIAPADLPRTESADDDLTRRVQEELMVRCGRQRGRVIAGLQIHVAGGTTVLICATFADMAIVQNELIGALQRILMRLGAPPQLLFTTRAGWEASSAGAGNVRSRPAATRGLPSTV